MKEKGIIKEALKRIDYYLVGKERVIAFFNLFLLIIASVLDVVGLASIVPVLMAAATPETVTSNKFLASVYSFLDFNSEKSFLVFLIIALFVFFIIKNLFTTWVNYKQVQFAARVGVNVIRRQFDKYTNLPVWLFNSIGSAEVGNAVYSVPQFFVNSIMRPLFALFSEIVIVAIIVVGILVYQPQLFFLLVIVLFPTAWVTYKLLRTRSERIGNRLNVLRPASYMVLLNTFNGFIELKLADKIKKFRNRFVVMQTEMQSLEAKSYLFTLIPIRVIEMVAILGIVTIFLFHLFYNQGSNFITLVGLFAAAAYRIMPSINRILTSMVTIRQFTYCIDYLDKYNEYEKECLNNENKGGEVTFTNELKLENVNFSFQNTEKATLKDINFTVKKGEKIGFIGSSGSGKTTLMNVLLGFYKQQSGEVLVDDVPLTDQNKLAWYNIVGYVKQDTFLMESSIKDNITLEDENVNEEMLDYAIERASLKEFVQTLPNGIDTLIGERGSLLSGGQKQRIGIARALYKNAQVLILDEATSALDNRTEKEVSEAIARLSDTDITVLMIAHRITTLRDCDRIYELKNGQIVDVHSYSEVLKRVME